MLSGTRGHVGREHAGMRAACRVAGCSRGLLGFPVFGRAQFMEAIAGQRGQVGDGQRVA